MVRKFLLVTVCLLLSALPAVAQEETEWSAWVMNGNVLYRVFLNGEVEEHILPLSDDYSATSIVLADDGIHIALCASGQNAAFRVLVIDSSDDSVEFELDLEEDMRFCSVQIDPNGSRVAIGARPGASDAGLESSTESSIRIFDVQSGRLIGELTDEQVYAVLPPYESIRSIDLAGGFSGDFILFTGPSNSLPLMPILMWNIRTGDITDIGFQDSLSMLGNVRLPATGEIIFPAEDFDYPNDYCRDGEGMCPNVLRATTDSSVEGSVIFHHSLYPVFSPIFAANGQYLLIKVFVHATNEETLALYGYTDSVPRWIALDRAGHTFELPAEVPVNFGAEPIGTPDGYIFLLHPTDAPVQLIHHRLTDEGVISREVLWQAPPAAHIRFLWWTELQGDPSLTPFNEMPPVVSDVPIIVPTTTAIPTAVQGSG